MFVSAGWLGWAVPLVIYLIKKDQSQFIKFHALQAMLLEALLFAVSIALLILTFATCGIGIFITLPLALVIVIAAIYYHIKAGMAANEGQWYELPLVGPYARRQVGI